MDWDKPTHAHTTRAHVRLDGSCFITPSLPFSRFPGRVDTSLFISLPSPLLYLSLSAPSLPLFPHLNLFQNPRKGKGQEI